jgi:hypothetical protein
MRILVFGVVAVACSVHAQSKLRLSSVAWAGLTVTEQATIQKQYLVEPLPLSSFGLVIDNQGVDRSTPGTNGAAGLGQAIGSAAYIDNAFKPSGNYSAKSHLAAILLGGFLGAAFDRPAQNQYQFRYAVKLADGNVAYYDAITSDPFRHPAGVCVNLPEVTLVSDQSLCTQTADSLRTRYLAENPNITHAMPVDAIDVAKDAVVVQVQETAPTVPIGTVVLCKIGLTAPVTTSLEKCSSINGVIIK